MKVIRVFEVAIVGTLGFLLFLHDRVLLFPAIWQDAVRIQDYIARFDETNTPLDDPKKMGQPMYPYLLEDAFKRFLFHLSGWVIGLVLYLCWFYLPSLITEGLN